MNLGACALLGSTNAGSVPFEDFFNINYNRNFFSGDIRYNSLFVRNLSFSEKPRSSYFFYKSVQVQGPGSFLVCFGKKKNHALGISYNYNVVKNFTADNSSLIQLASPSSFFLPSNFSSGKFTAKSLSWVDLGVTYSPVLVRREKHLFKMGFTLKYIMGTGYAISKGQNLYFSDNGDGTGTLSGEFSHNQSSDFLVSNTQTNFGTIDLNSGFAGDLGFVYEWRPKASTFTYEMDSIKFNVRRDLDLYTLRLAFSVSDLGFVGLNYQNTSLSAIMETQSREGFNNLITGVSQPNSYTPFPTPGKVNFILPMRFNFSLDYNIYKGLGLNFMGRFSPVLSSDNYVRHPSELVFTPRYDHKWAGLYLPLAYDFNKNISLGFAARLGPVFIGFDNFLMFGASKNSYRAGGYVGIKLPIPFRIPKDKDGDKVSDRFYDRCLNEVGNWYTKGCLDKDGDNIADIEDKCPLEKGLLVNQGCPDKDGDGLADMEDRCPDAYGLPETMGCPDTDGDGVADREDSCIDVAGPKEFLGCPDTDGDGLADNVDRCAKLKGLAEHHGCPDTDNDGVFDDIDPCVEEPGAIANNGCPWLDSDGDGVMDNEDSCVFEKGTKEYNGCKKPMVPKVTSYEVCYDTLWFDIGSQVITVLNMDKIKNIIEKELNRNPSYNVKLIGYTDEWETDKTNYEALSRQRALVVRQYFIDNGLEANRITYDGFGNENPVGDNKTWSGRRKNRRVEIYIQFGK